MNEYSEQGVATYLESALSPPEHCYTQCIIDASEVQILYWPVETSTGKANNVATTVAPTPYTLVFDGFSQ